MLENKYLLFLLAALVPVKLFYTINYANFFGSDESGSWKQPRRCENWLRVSFTEL